MKHMRITSKQVGNWIDRVAQIKSLIMPIGNIRKYTYVDPHYHLPREELGSCIHSAGASPLHLLGANTVLLFRSEQLKDRRSQPRTT
jgi:hypothetical protein